MPLPPVKNSLTMAYGDGPATVTPDSSSFVESVRNSLQALASSPERRVRQIGRSTYTSVFSISMHVTDESEPPQNLAAKAPVVSIPGKSLQDWREDFIQEMLNSEIVRRVDEQYAPKMIGVVALPTQLELGFDVPGLFMERIAGANMKEVFAHAHERNEENFDPVRTAGHVALKVLVANEAIRASAQSINYDITHRNVMSSIEGEIRMIDHQFYSEEGAIVQGWESPSCPPEFFATPSGGSCTKKSISFQVGYMTDALMKICPAPKPNRLVMDFFKKSQNKNPSNRSSPSELAKHAFLTDPKPHQEEIESQLACIADEINAARD